MQKMSRISTGTSFQPNKEITLVYKFFTKSAVIVMTILLSGCGFSVFSSRETNPVVQDVVSDWFFLVEPEYGVLSMRPERRAVLYNFQNGSPTYGSICAEPPADVAEAYASAVQAGLSGDIAAKEIFEGQFGSSLTTAISQLTRRSQGLQWLRDQMFYLCIERMNGVITNDQYFGERIRLSEISKGLILSEIDKLPAFGENLRPNDAPAITSKSTTNTQSKTQ